MTIWSTITKKFRAPPLPKPTIQYDSTYLDNLVNVLRLYFNQLDDLLEQISTVSSNAVKLPHGSFSDTTTQTVTAINTATPIAFNTTDSAIDVSIVSSSRVTVTIAGIYNIQFSVQLQNSSTSPDYINIWLSLNGVNVAGTNGVVSIPGKHGSDPGSAISGWNYFISMAANDYVELYWSSATTTITMPFLSAGVSPTRPSTASSILTVAFVSADT